MASICMNHITENPCLVVEEDCIQKDPYCIEHNVEKWIFTSKRVLCWNNGVKNSLKNRFDYQNSGDFKLDLTLDHATTEKSTSQAVPEWDSNFIEGYM